jgi:CHAT domain-containing protein
MRDIHLDMLRGDLTVAESKAQQERKSFTGRNAEWATKFRLLEAEILSVEGRSPDVIALLSDDRSFSPAGGDVAIKREMLRSLAYAHLGKPQLADQQLQAALQLSQSSHSELEGEVLRTQGIIEIHRNQITDADNSFRQSLDIARKQKDKLLEASNLLNLGWSALQTEHLGEALDWFNESSMIARPIQARVILETDLGNVGWAYYKLGDFEKALTNFQQAEEQARNLGSAVARIAWLNNAGLCLYQLGDLKGAEDYYRRALQAAQAIDNKELIANTHTWIGILYLQLGQLDSAKLHSDEAIQAARSSGDKSTELDPLFLSALLAARKANGPDAERLLVQVHQQSAGTPSLQWEVENSLANFYADGHQPQQAEIWYRKSMHTFETQRSSVKDEELKLPFFANGDAIYRDYAEFLIASNRSDEALQLLDLGRARSLEEGLRTEKQKGAPNSSLKEAVDAQSVARKLDATILFYSLGPKKSYLWSVTGRRTQLFVLPGQSEIESRVQRYQKTLLRSSDPLRDANEDAQYLYNTIVAPAAATIPQGSKVFLITDGALNGLNFETLLAPSAEGLHYWIENVTATSANSIRLLSRFNPNPSARDTKNLLLIGNPISPGSEYEDLPNAATEIGSIERHFPSTGRTVVKQAQAVPSAYAANKPDRFSYIHFVAHGTASRLSPLDSAVVLSASPAHPDSFKLYAHDIVHQPLHARLVTISACYGSGLRAYAGEGLVGLSWAFLRAGAHNVIGALWAANDASTPLLMDKLYGDLETGSSPDTALRAAKLSLIHSQGVYRKPLYWGAFQLYAGS